MTTKTVMFGCILQKNNKDDLYWYIIIIQTKIALYIIIVMLLDNNQLEKTYAVWLCREKKKFLRENLDKTVICKLASNIKLIP